MTKTYIYFIALIILMAPVTHAKARTGSVGSLLCYHSQIDSYAVDYASESFTDIFIDFFEEAQSYNDYSGKNLWMYVDSDDVPEAIAVSSTSPDDSVTFGYQCRFERTSNNQFEVKTSM